MFKVLTVVGARPQFIKAAVLSRFWQSEPIIDEVLVHTGQHYDPQMSDVFFTDLEIPQPKYNLAIGSGKHGEQTGKMLIEIEKVIDVEKPNLVLVYGDTNSTLAGALAAVKLHIPIAHVEAGLRSFNKKMPEEMNRVLTDHCSDLLFAPTAQAEQNLIDEGISLPKIHQVGDIMYESALYFVNITNSSSLINLGIKPKEYILVTVHRAENTDTFQYLRTIFSELIKVSLHIKVVVPLHPRTRKALGQYNLLSDVENSLQVIAPCGYLDMVALEKNARLIITDSGGVQKEAYFYQVPCLTLRAETEWIETVTAGGNHLLPPDRFDQLFAMTRKLLDTDHKSVFKNLYGDGTTSKQISEVIKNFLDSND